MPIRGRSSIGGSSYCVSCIFVSLAKQRIKNAVVYISDFSCADNIWLFFLPGEDVLVSTLATVNDNQITDSSVS